MKTINCFLFIGSILISMSVDAQEMVADLVSTEKIGSEVSKLENLNGTLVFTAKIEKLDAANVKRKETVTLISDGTATGTSEILPHMYRNYKEEYIVFGNSLYFYGSIENTLGFWKYTIPNSINEESKKEKKGFGKKLADNFIQGVSGSNQNGNNDQKVPQIAGLTKLSSVWLSGNQKHIVIYNDQIYFVSKNDNGEKELYKTDGTVKGTIQTGVIFPKGKLTTDFSLIVAGGLIYFNSKDNNHGVELWATDGTPTGTRIVKDINQVYLSTGDTQDSKPMYLTEANGKLFFIADDGVNGRQLWVTDGTEKGTQMIKNISVAKEFQNRNGKGANCNNLTKVGNWLFFTAHYEYHDFLFKTNGAENGTVLLCEVKNASNFTEADGELYFTSYWNKCGKELSKSDGTPKGTRMIKDINPGGNDGCDMFGGPQTCFANGRIYFVANDGVHGYELWVTDGTVNGTNLVKDIKPFGNFGSEPKELTYINGVLYFSADDGPHGRELWKYIVPDVLPVTKNSSSSPSANEEKNNSGSSNSSLCFYGKTKGYECDMETQLQLNFNDSQITGSHSERCGGGSYTKSRVEGFQKSDSLFLNIFTMYGKNETKMPTIWLLKADKLSQFDTETKNGKARLTPGAKKPFSNITNKVTCK